METINLMDNLMIIIPIGIIVAIFAGVTIRYFVQKHKTPYLADINSVLAGLLIALLVGMVSFVCIGACLESIKAHKYNELVAAKYDITPNITSMKQVGKNNIAKEITRVKNNYSDEYKDVYIVHENDDVYIYMKDNNGLYTKCDKIFE